jgi:competence ComEA-like helix-hairpin-helix protein
VAEDSPFWKGSGQVEWIWKERDLKTLSWLMLLACFGVSARGWSLAGPSGRRFQTDQPLRQPIDYRVDLNRATWIEYVMVPGIGEKTARAIVLWRSEHGPFTSVDELDQVPGIGPVTREKARPFLFVTPSVDPSKPS